MADEGPGAPAMPSGADEAGLGTALDGIGDDVVTTTKAVAYAPIAMLKVVVATTGALTAAAGVAFLWWTSTRRPRIGRKEEEEAARRRREAEERARSIRVGRSEGGGRVLRVVVTGGPASGRPTVISQLTSHFSARGWRVFRPPDAATLLLSGGVSLDGTLESMEVYRSQEALLHTTVALEKGMVSTARAGSRDTLVLCDGGTMDCAAYIDGRMLDMLAEDANTNRAALRDRRYDMVVHLVSAAIGAEAEFDALAGPGTTLFAEESVAGASGVDAAGVGGHDDGSSSARAAEEIAAAKELDARMVSAWVGHPRLVIVDNSTSFPVKVARAVAAVCRRVDEVPPPPLRQRYEVTVDEAGLAAYETVEWSEEIFALRPSNDRRVHGVVASTAYGDGTITFVHRELRQVGRSSRRAAVQRPIDEATFISLRLYCDPEAQVIRKDVQSFTHHGDHYEIERRFKRKLSDKSYGADPIVILTAPVPASGASAQVNVPDGVKLIRSLGA